MDARYKIQVRSHDDAEYPWNAYPDWATPRRIEGDFECPDRGAACLLRNGFAHSWPVYHWRVIDATTGQRVDDF